MQIMYGLEGRRRLTEYELDWLPGYEGSKPVRVGNAASGQFQLDVYGEVLSCLYAGRKMGLAGRAEGLAALGQILNSSRAPGNGPTTASGRCAAAAGTSPTRRSWPGWPSIAR